jgi:ATP-binding protein involved in chromosome partitioning
MDPELGGNVVELGMVGEVRVDADGFVTVPFKLTIKGCPLRAQLKKDVETRIGTHPGVKEVVIDWSEMTAEERSDTMLKARWNARRRPTRRSPPRPESWPSHRARVGWASLR